MILTAIEEHHVEKRLLQCPSALGRQVMVIWPTQDVAIIESAMRLED
jgi:hypothetical protein